MRVAEGAVGIQHGLDDFRRGLFVKDALVAPLARQPGPGAEFQVIAVAVLVHADPDGAGDDAVEPDGFPDEIVDLDPAVGAEQVVEIDVGIGRQRLHPVVEQRVHRVGAGETQQDQRVLAEIGVKSADPVGLGKRGVHRNLPGDTKSS